MKPLFKLIVFMVPLILLSCFLLAAVFLVFNLDPNNSLYSVPSLLLVGLFLYVIYIVYDKKYINPPISLLLSINIQMMLGLTLILLAVYYYKLMNNIRIDYLFSIFSLVITILGILYSIISDNYTSLKKYRVNNVVKEEKKLELINQMYKNIQNSKKYNKRDLLRTNKYKKRKNHRKVYKSIKQPSRM